LKNDPRPPGEIRVSSSLARRVTRRTLRTRTRARHATRTRAHGHARAYSASAARPGFPWRTIHSRASIRRAISLEILSSGVI
jgi:hypothetical protein